MKANTSRTRRIALLSSIVVLFMSAPVAFSQRSVVEFNDACAQSGTCCPSYGSYCELLEVADYYEKSSGSCNSMPGVARCCDEPGSLCMLNSFPVDNHFYSESGNC
ncbi:MAG: hypothetical protein LCH84_12355 [Gemmatimonadetes bacterium]|nr:hypothetical protein [Gemmatimonadota bacterium]